MDVTARRERGLGVPLGGLLLSILLSGALVALAGGYWDDAWHTERGRDDFFIAPHVAIYGGVSLAGIALSVWAAAAVRARGPRAALSYPPLALALAAVTGTLLSAPVDNAWHLAFGRDAVIWSPPHVLGIVGTASLAFAVLLELSGAAESRWRRGAPVAAALALAGLSFLVVEFETDVPQFDPIWYLPVLATVSAFALGVTKLLDPHPLAAARAAGFHLFFVLGVSGFLLAAGFEAPRAPLLLVPALVLDVAARSGAAALVRGLAYGLVLVATYLVGVALAPGALHVSAGDVTAGLPLALAGSAVAVWVTSGRVRRAAVTRGHSVAAVVVLVTLCTTASASAHDPGQGKPAGDVALAVAAKGGRLSVHARLSAEACRGITRAAVVARRAGREEQATLELAGCRGTGALSVTQAGRWFVYLELHGRRRTVESWLPVTVGDGRSQTVDPHRFAYVADREPGGTTKAVAAVILYGAMLVLLAVVTLLARREAARRLRSLASPH